MFPVGNKLRIHLFGKSHAECLGCILEGFPTDFEIDLDEMDRQIALRKPSDGIGTPRKEKDAIVFEHGVKDGKTTDSTIEMVIYNGNRDSSAYSGFNITPRPGHSDLPALFKFKNYDVSGGAQFSGRMTAPLVAAGALAKQYLKGKGVEIHAFSKSIGTVRDVRACTLPSQGDRRLSSLTPPVKLEEFEGNPDTPFSPLLLVSAAQ